MASYRLPPDDLSKMKQILQQIEFDNKTNPQSYFELIRIEDLLARNLDHDLGRNHVVRFFIIFFVMEGEGYHTIDFVDYKYQSGTVLLIRKDQIHKFFRSPNVKGYLLVFTEDFIISHLNKLEALKAFQLFNELLSFPKLELEVGDEEYGNFVSLMRQLESEYRYKDEYSIGITRSALHIVITKLFRIKAGNDLLQGKKKYLAEFLLFQAQVEK
ncbi:MAG: AraC family ligand binding domain-containing protein, partial [Bacteroidota bacterium]